MKYLFCICGFLICFNLSGQVLKQNELDYINYMTDPTHAKVMGSGEVVDEIRAIETSIEEIIVGNGIQLFLTQGNEPNIKVVAQRNALPLISTEVKDKKLIVGLSASLETSKGIKLYVSLGSIASINIKQGSYLNIPNELNFNKLDLLVQSGALADCHVLADNFFCTVMGGSVLNLTGKVFKHADIFVKGGSILQGKTFECTECNVTVLGASKCKLNVTDLLDARVENESLFAYSGNPNIRKKITNFGGKIRHRFIF